MSFHPSVVFQVGGRHGRHRPIPPPIYRDSAITSWYEEWARKEAQRLALEVGQAVEQVISCAGRKVVVAVTASSQRSHRRWILDSGAGRHFISKKSAQGLRRIATDAVRLMTANGVIHSKECVKVRILGELTADALVLP